MPKSHNQFLFEMKNLVNEEYLVLEQYRNSRTKIKVKHQCGFIYKIRPDHFLSGTQRCPICTPGMNRTTESLKKQIELLTDGEYEVIGEYRGTKSKILIRHIKCDYVWNVLPDNFVFKGSRCPKCAGNAKRNTEQFKAEILKLTGNEYSVLGRYINNETKIKMQHNVCGNVYYVSPAKFTSTERRCPFCNASKGERKIKEWLESNGLKYEMQFRISNCKSKRPLPFDFKVDYQGKVILIEYDGIQHFKPTDRFQGIEGLKATKRNDVIKTNYCLIHNIPLLRITYEQYDEIADILSQYFSQVKAS